MSTAFSSQHKNLLSALVLLHLLIIAASNYLVQIPVDIFGFHATWGSFTFPLIFLASDLTVRLYGAKLARRIILTAMFPALLLSYVVSVLFFEGTFMGFSGLSELNVFVARIAIASFIAYIVGQLLDVWVFSRLRGSKNWWKAPALSTTVGGFVDTLLFFAIAFYASEDAFMAANWPEIAAVDYVFKLGISLLLFVPAYGFLMSMISDKLKTRFA